MNLLYTCLHLLACAYIKVLTHIFDHILQLLLQLSGSKPLHLAAVKGNMDVMRILITDCGCKADLGDEVLGFT